MQEKQIGENLLNYFKPQLTPNFGRDDVIDWDALIKVPSQWMWSIKGDGIRAEIFTTGTLLSRSLKPFKSRRLNAMAKEITDKLEDGHVLEAEIWSPEMTFSEISHFVKTEDLDSQKTITKYTKLWEKTGGEPEWIIDPKKGKINIGWPYPGRSLEWVLIWPEDLKFWCFDMYSKNHPDRTKEQRVVEMQRLLHDAGIDLATITVFIQRVVESVEEIRAFCDAEIAAGGEGIMVFKRSGKYKMGRCTINENTSYKMKDDRREYFGTIVDATEATKAIEGSEKTQNELGRSVTSKKKEDREPAGYVGGLLVEMEDGVKLIVMLNGFNQDEKVNIWNNKTALQNVKIKFTAMPPVKEGGSPRSAIFTKGDIVK